MKHLGKKKKKMRKCLLGAWGHLQRLLLLARGTPGRSKHHSGRNEWRECRAHLEAGLCLVVMCQFITFCDSASRSLRAFPQFVQLLSSIEGNVGYINTGDSLGRSLCDFSIAQRALTTVSQLRCCRGVSIVGWEERSY